jgi:hypothetical protein
MKDENEFPEGFAGILAVPQLFQGPTTVGESYHAVG